MAQSGNAPPIEGGDRGFESRSHPLWIQVDPCWFGSIGSLVHVPSILREWRNGSRAGLRGQWEKSRMGSNPISRTGSQSNAEWRKWYTQPVDNRPWRTWAQKSRWSLWVRIPPRISESFPARKSRLDRDTLTGIGTPVRDLTCARSSAERASDYESEGREFKSLRARKPCPGDLAGVGCN